MRQCKGAIERIFNWFWKGLIKMKPIENEMIAESRKRKSDAEMQNETNKLSPSKFHAHLDI